MGRRPLLVGVITGLFSGLTGVGGGAILVSLLVSVMGMTQRTAQGSTPAIIIPVALLGAAVYAIQGISGQFPFDTSLALTIIPALAFPSMAGVIIGATWMSALPAAQLRRAFGVFLFLIAFLVLTRDILPVGAAVGGPVTVPFIFWILLGFVAGVFAGFLGIGGAIVMVPFMSLGAGIPQHMAQGVTLAVVTVTTVVGAIAQYRLGNTNLQAVRVVAPVATVVVIFASLAAGRIEGGWLTRLFGLAMVYFGYQFTFIKRPPSTPQATTNPSAGFYSI